MIPKARYVQPDAGYAGIVAYYHGYVHVISRLLRIRISGYVFNGR